MPVHLRALSVPLSLTLCAAALPAVLLATAPAASGQDAVGAVPAPQRVALVRVDPQRPTRNASFVSPLTEVFGNVALGRHSFVASNTVLRADPGGRVCLGNDTNVQDNVSLLALRSGVRRPGLTWCGGLSATAASRTSIAHQATIQNSAVGDFAFIGFRALVRNSTVGSGAFVLHGAVVDGVRIPVNRVVPIGARITTQAQANALAPIGADQVAFKQEVLEVNEEFAESYRELYHEKGFAAVTGVSQQPVTSFNPRGVQPQVRGVGLSTFTRVVGDVRIGAGSSLGRRTSVRADEGAPIIIGASSVVEDRVTFHALKGTSIRIGARLRAEDNIVFHGPLTAGDDLVVRDDAILFRSVVGNRVELGEGSIVVGVTLRDGAVVPPGALVLTQAAADALAVR
jgi:carbon dioxide concentrating mechanism protein CcmM